MYPKNKPLPEYQKQFDLLSKEEQDAILAVQQFSKRYWWNPECKTKCTGHRKVHKYSFEAYVEGWVSGYYGFDTIREMLSWAETGE